MLNKERTLNWQLQDSKREYYKLNDIDLSHSHFNNLSGVYVIWYRQGGRNTTVYAGQAKNGLIRNRLSAHRDNPKIQSYASKTLYVAWAKAMSYEIDGIEKYLHNTLNPLVTERTPNADAIHVNLPWG